MAVCDAILDRGVRNGVSHSLTLSENTTIACRACTSNELVSVFKCTDPPPPSPQFLKEPVPKPVCLRGLRATVHRKSVHKTSVEFFTPHYSVTTSTRYRKYIRKGDYFYRRHSRREKLCKTPVTGGTNYPVHVQQSLHRPPGLTCG